MTVTASMTTVRCLSSKYHLRPWLGLVHWSFSENASSSNTPIIIYQCYRFIWIDLVFYAYIGSLACLIVVPLLQITLLGNHLSNNSCILLPNKVNKVSRTEKNHQKHVLVGGLADNKTLNVMIWWSQQTLTTLPQGWEDGGLWWRVGSPDVGAVPQFNICHSSPVCNALHVTYPGSIIKPADDTYGSQVSHAAYFSGALCMCR